MVLDNGARRSQINLRIPDELRDRLRAEAARQDATFSSLVTRYCQEGLDREVAKKEPKKPKVHEARLEREKTEADVPKGWQDPPAGVTTTGPSEETKRHRRFYMDKRGDRFWCRKCGAGVPESHFV